MILFNGYASMTLATGTGKKDCEERSTWFDASVVRRSEQGSEVDTFETGSFSSSNIFDYYWSCTLDRQEVSSTDTGYIYVWRSEQGSKVGTFPSELALPLPQKCSPVFPCSCVIEIGPFYNRGLFARAIVIHDHNGPRRVRREIFSVAIATIQPGSRRPPILSIGDPIGDRG
nr:unnamed protein product [Haemonchus contortus]